MVTNVANMQGRGRLSIPGTTVELRPDEVRRVAGMCAMYEQQRGEKPSQQVAMHFVAYVVDQRSK